MFQSALLTTLTPMCNGTVEQTTSWNQGLAHVTWPHQISTTECRDKKTAQISKIKKKRNRTMFTTDQLLFLEGIFSKTKYIDSTKRRELAQALQISDRCIKIWFQNRRMKEKKESRESSFPDTEYSIESTSPSYDEYEPKYLPQINNIYNLDDEKTNYLKHHVNTPWPTEYGDKYSTQFGINYNFDETNSKYHNTDTSVSTDYYFKYLSKVNDCYLYPENSNYTNDHENSPLSTEHDANYALPQVINLDHKKINYFNDHVINNTCVQNDYFGHPVHVDNVLLSPEFSENSLNETQYCLYPKPDNNVSSNTFEEWSQTFDLTYL